MATYLELRKLFNNTELRNLIEVAVAVAADAIRSEGIGVSNHPNRLLWAKRAWQNPEAEAKSMLIAVLAANKGVDLADITGAEDVTIQTAVDAAVNVLAGE